MVLRGFASAARICGHTFIPRLLSTGSTIVDLGVNEALFAEAMLKRFNSQVYGAEPVPELFGLLPLRDRLHVLPVAVGGTTGKAILNVYRHTCSSILARPQSDVGKEVQVDV